MKIRALFIILCLACPLVLTACTGYNNIMYEHLSSIENYKTYEAEIEQIYVYDEEKRKLVEYDKAIHGEDNLGTVYFYVSAEDSSQSVRLEVTPDNNQLLVSNGFYNDFAIGNAVEIQASDWIYMDTDFFYIIGIKYGETQYLNGEDGLQNIVEMMDKDRSLF